MKMKHPISWNRKDPVRRVHSRVRHDLGAITLPNNVLRMGIASCPLAASGTEEARSEG